MIQIEKERRTEIKKTVLAALMHGLSPCALPIKIKEITRSFLNIKLIPYSKHLKRMNISYLEVVHLCESYDACTDYYPKEDMYYIYYNDIDNNIKTSNRYRWNIAHELGHVLLKHHIKYNKTRIFRSSLTNVEYKYLEEEADYFAQLILVPHPPLYIFKIRNHNNIKYLCQISRPAAYKRFIAYRQWIRNINSNDFYDKCIFYLYYDYLFKKICMHCGATLIQEKGEYCPICGSKSLQWGDGKLKYTKYLYDTDHNGKLTICPTCKNEDIHAGDYCSICGRSLINTCDYYDHDGYHDSPTGCKKVLAPNARFCPHCGLPSNFHRHQLLSEWQVEKEESEAVRDNSKQISIPTIQLENLNLILKDWGNIIRNLGGALLPSFRDTVLEPYGDSCLCIVFSNQDSYAIGSRPTALGELEQYVEKQYGKEIYFKARMKNTSEQLKTIYVGDNELQKAIHLDISIND